MTRVFHWLEEAARQLNHVADCIYYDKHGIPSCMETQREIDTHLAEMQKALFRARGELMGYSRPDINHR